MPSLGMSDNTRRTSAKNSSKSSPMSGWCCSRTKVKIRRCPNVPWAVVTVRAAISGRVVEMTPAATGTVSPAASRRSAATTPGANSLFLTARTSSVRRSRPIRCEAGASTPASALHGRSPLRFSVASE